MDAIIANDSELVELLLKNKANPNIIVPSTNETMLFLAGRSNSVEIMKLLYQYKFDFEGLINVKDTVYGYTIFQKLCHFGRLNCLEYLVSLCHEIDRQNNNNMMNMIDNWTVDKSNNNALEISIFYRHASIVKYLLENVYFLNRSPIQNRHKAIENDNESKTGDNYYNDNNGIFNHTSGLGYNVTHVALAWAKINENSNNNNGINDNHNHAAGIDINTDQQNNIDIFKLLFHYGKEHVYRHFGEYDNKGYLPIHLACCCNNYTLLKYLFENHFDLVNNVINKKSNNKWCITPLMYALEKNHNECVKILCQYDNVEINVNTLRYCCLFGNVDGLKILLVTLLQREDIIDCNIDNYNDNNLFTSKLFEQSKTVTIDVLKSLLIEAYSENAKRNSNPDNLMSIICMLVDLIGYCCKRGHRMSKLSIGNNSSSDNNRKKEDSKNSVIDLKCSFCKEKNGMFNADGCYFKCNECNHIFCDECRIVSYLKLVKYHWSIFERYKSNSNIINKV